MKRWQKLAVICVGVTAIITSGYTVTGLLTGLLTRVDARYEKAEAAEQKHQQTQEQLRDISNILQTNALEKLEGELRELKVKRNKTSDDEKRILELQDRIKRLEGGGKK